MAVEAGQQGFGRPFVPGEERFVVATWQKCQFPVGRSMCCADCRFGSGHAVTVVCDNQRGTARAVSAGSVEANAESRSRGDFLLPVRILVSDATLQSIDCVVRLACVTIQCSRSGTDQFRFGVSDGHLARAGYV